MTVGPMSAPVAFWTLAFFAAAAVLVLFKAWRGWKLGAVRQVTGLIALVAAALCGLFGGTLLAPLLRSVWPGPDRVLAVAGGLVLSLTVWLVITLVSALVFKKTEHQSVGLVRFGFGLVGALVGAGYGLILVWLLILAARLLGTVAETQLAVEKNPRVRSAAAATPAPAGPVIGGLAHLKQALEHGTVGAVVEQIDPLPGTVYSTLGKLGRTVADPRSMERFAQYPGVRPLLQQPKLAALFHDASIAKAAGSRDYLALLSHPRVVAAANDPELAAMLRRVDLEKALDFALAAPEEKKREW